jgi:hypothetical protein
MAMRGISLKALLISNVAYVLLAVILAILVTVAAVAIAIVGYGSATPQAFDAFRTSQAVLISEILFLIVGASLGAGYVAGRVAKRKYLLNGALATSGSILLTLCGLIIGGSFFDDSSNFARWVDTLLNTVILVGGPILALLGGYFAELRQRRLDSLSAAQRAGRGFWSSALTVMRWVAAFFVAMAVYIGFFKLVRLAVGHSLLTVAFAVTFAIIFATFVVPASQRKIACLLFVAIAILLPTEEFVRHALLGAMSYIDGLVVLLNVVGALLAYWHLRRVFPQNSSDGGPRAAPVSSSN